jgi:hypothetical protein
LYVTEGKGFIAQGLVRAPEKGELKNEGLSHYVIENKYTKISISANPIISMKIKGLFY